MRTLLLESLFKSVQSEPISAHDPLAGELGEAIARTAFKRLGRSLSIREVDAGSCNGGELEINALSNP
jgi:hypothetical protein